MMHRLLLPLTLAASIVSCSESDPFRPDETDCTGEFSYMEVGYWERTLLSQAWVPGVTGSGFDTRKVCLKIAIASWDVLPRLEARLLEIGIPRGAVYVVISPMIDASL
jgi:hypothetical protein